MAFVTPSLAGLVIIASAIIYNYVKSYITERRFRRFAAANGAEPTPHTPFTLIPWGLGGLWRVMRAEKKGLDIFDDIVTPSFATVGGGCKTYEGTGLLGQEIMNTIDPRNIQEILSTNVRDWVTGERRYGQFGVPILGRGVFTTDGSEWSYHRSLFRPQFSRERINDLAATENACRAYLDVLPAAEEGEWTDEVDMMPLFYHFTLDTVTAFLFGESVNSQRTLAMKERPNDFKEGTAANAATARLIDLDSRNDGLRFAEAFHLVQSWLGFRIRMQSLYWLVDGFNYRRAAAKVRHFADHYVQLALKEHASRRATTQVGEKGMTNDRFGTSKWKTGFLERLTNETQDPITLRNQVLALMFAGRDTTANFLGWFFIMLAQNPRVYKKLRAAILESFGPGPDVSRLHSGSDSSTLDFAALRSCRYLQYCMDETSRLWPVTPVNNRFALNDTILPQGGGKDGSKPCAIRKGQLCNMLIYPLHRSTEIWGEDAAEFRPERWEGRKHDWNFLPFSAGPRVCMGQQYALTEAAYLTVRVLQKFDDIEWAGPPGKPAKAFGIVMYPRDGVKVRFRKAANIKS